MLSLIENEKAVPSVYVAMSLAKIMGLSVERMFPVREAERTHRRKPSTNELTKGGGGVAKNTGLGYRRGAVRSRSQSEAPNGNFVKRDRKTGRFVKQAQKAFKGVRKEK